MPQLLQLILYLLFVLFIAIYIYLKYYVYNYWKRHNIPHETPSIPQGNVPLSFIFGKTTFGNFLKESYEKHSQHPFYGIYIFYQPILVINDPELIRTVLVKEFSRFYDRGFFMDEKVDPLSANLILQSGEKWRRLRAKFTPAFTPGKLKKLNVLVREISDEMIETCDSELKFSEVLDMKNIIARYTTDIISSTVYGFNCNSLKNPNNDFRRIGMKAIHIGRIIMVLGFYFPNILKSIPLPFYKKNVKEFFKKIFSDTVNYRREQKIVRNDLTNVLMELMDNNSIDDDQLNHSNEENRDDDRISMSEAAAHAFVSFVSGFETSSATTTFCLLELAMNPDIQEKLQQEIDEVAKSSDGFTYDNIMEMEYLDMVLSETIRKYPTTGSINRICTEDFQIPDTNYTIKKGMRILCSPPGIHHNPKFFPDPCKFDPTRFTKENLASRSPYVHLGFGEGPRYCIGKKLSLLEMKQALVSLLYNYTFRICDKTPLPVKLKTETFLQIPRDPIFLRLEKRRK